MTEAMAKIHDAKKVAYSSVVGQSIMLMNASGACIAQLSVINTSEPQQIADEVVAALKAPNRHAYKVGVSVGKSAQTDPREAALQDMAEFDGKLLTQPDPVKNAHPDDTAVDRFAAAMKAKLSAARAKGRSGWDDPEACSVEFLARLLKDHMQKVNSGNFEDIANLCMMLHQRGADPAILAQIRPDPVKDAAQWRPIETAPKDGSVILVWHVHQANKYACFDSNIKKARWIDDLGEWQVDGIGGNVPPKISHWMPLPPAPHAITEQEQRDD